MTEKIVLLSPVDGITEIELREPTVDEIAKLTDDQNKFGGVRAMKNLISMMAGVEISVVGRMGVRDFNACNKYLSAFLE